MSYTKTLALILVLSVALLSRISLAPSAVAKEPSSPKCEAIPSNVGNGVNFFHVRGQQQAYDRSICYMDEAIEQDDPRFCSNVRQRRYLFQGDGSYYSPDSCRQQIEWRREEARAPKIDPSKSYKISKVSIDIVGDKFVDVRFSLTDKGQPGLYTIALECESTLDPYNVPERKLPRTSCGNLVPQTPRINYLNRFQPFGRIVQSQTIQLSPDNDIIEFRVRAKQIRRALEDRRSGAPVYLTATLGLLVGDDGSVRDPSVFRETYIDAFEILLPPNGHASFSRFEQD